jgi:hypothetical protein
MKIPYKRTLYNATIIIQLSLFFALFKIEMCDAHFLKLCVYIVLSCTLVIEIGAKMSIALKYFHT